MANKTNILSIFSSLNNKEEAQKYLKEMYPDIIYNAADDSYEYRGYKFDYFQSGINPNTNSGTYLLVDTDEAGIWLFTYGDQEQRWKDYLRHKQGTV